MEWFDNHRKLFTTAFLFFAGLTLMVAILPALHNQAAVKPLPGAHRLSEEEARGRQVFISNGCVACHTQQVRDVEMDKQWGSRPSLAADYAANKRVSVWQNTATLMGTERTGPDLTDIGRRQPSSDWHFAHLFNPRIVVKESIMPAYTWLFEIKQYPAKGDKVINIPAEYRDGGEGKVVATQDAICLVAYLQSLKQLKLPDGTQAPLFLYKRGAAPAGGGGSTEPDGKQLFEANCQACHQANGEGLPGAFPSLKGSPVVTGDDLNKYVDIIMNGYNGRPGFGAMPPVGTNASFSEHELAAIMNYERTSWGNSARQVTPDEIKAILTVIKLQSAK